MQTNAQIVVGENPVPTTVWTALRYLLTAAGAWAIGEGYLNEGAVQAIITVIITVGPLIFGAWKAYDNRKKLVVTAEAAPDRVAVVKS